MANYFKNIPNLEYPSLLNDRKGSSDTVRVKNLFRRVIIRDDYFTKFVNFTKYKIVGDDRPDNTSEDVYGTPNLDWLILTANNIIDIKNDWPMTEYDLNLYLNQKYTPQQLAEIHHYETIEWRDFDNQLVVKGGQWVDENFSVQYLRGGQVRRVSPIKSVSYFEWELNQNDEKRNINVVSKEYVPLVLKDFENIMTYGKSSQYVADDLKKTENIRITG